MKFNFLEAADGSILSKRFTRAADGSVVVQPYPHVRDMNSYEHDLETVAELMAAVQEHGANGHCMLKGELVRPIQNESRAGMTDAAAATEWVLLDLDFESGWDSIDEFIADLNPAWSQTSYIWQHSASAGVKYKPGLRGHLFLLLEEPIAPALLKTWLRERNMIVDQLRKQCELSANGHTLRWPLDISTCQNDKLIFIAPPEIDDTFDPLPFERYELVEKKKPRGKLPFAQNNAAVIDGMIEGRIAELRKEAGLKARKPRFDARGSLHVLKNPEVAEITSTREARGFVYLNFNGGDSWAYYFPKEQPDIVRNFKEEPAVYLRDIAPDFYRDYTKQLAAERHGDVRAYGFREPTTDTYFGAVHDPVSGRLLAIDPIGAKDRMRDFLAQYAVAMPDPVPDWKMVFDPTITATLDASQRWVNRYQPTDLVLAGKSLPKVKDIPPVIDRVLRSICNNDGVVMDHFINWLACLVQTREHIQTAWVFHGVQGTGKGILYNHILKPLIGEPHCTMWTTKEFEDNFNAAIERSCVLWLDEFRASDGRADSIMSRLKQLITEPTVAVRAMRTDTVTRPNYANVIIATNYADPIVLDPNDRRFNVAPAQRRKLRVTSAEIQALHDEVEVFAAYLFHHEADLDKARVILETPARMAMMRASRNTFDAFFDAVRDGDLQYFMHYLSEEPPVDNVVGYHRFRSTVLKWMEVIVEAKRRTEQNSAFVEVTWDTLRELHGYVSGKMLSPAKFRRSMSVRHIDIEMKNNALNLKLRHSSPEIVKRLLLQAREEKPLSTVAGGKS